MLHSRGFGGKSRAAHLVWPRFGDTPNYIEPFFGSGAVLLARPHEPRVETVNDIDAYIANFWRAVQLDSEEVARHCDWPVNEADLHARHRWLVETAKDRIEKVKRDPDYCSQQIAGWWVYGQCLWIGSGWCASPEWTGRTRGTHTRGRNPERYAARPDLTATRGVIKTRNGDTSEQARRPQLTNDSGLIALGGASSWNKRPYSHRGDGRGAVGLSRKRPAANGNGQAGGVHRRWNSGGAGAGQGVHAQNLVREQIPQLSGDGSGAQRGCLTQRSDGLYAYMAALQARLRRVRVCCGDWRRVLTPAVTSYIGLTGVFLDPPYSQQERSICYAHDNDVAADVRTWALAHGDDPVFRIALCGYEGEHEMPDSWECVRWKAGGGYGRSSRGRANRHRERIWFSPHCLRPRDGLQFDEPVDVVAHK